MTRHRTVEHHPHPLLSEAMAEVAHPQIRARGTLGGNLAHADPASEMPAVMLALDASFDLLREGGARRLPAMDFFLAPLTTALEPDELLAAIRIPPLPPGTGNAFLELARRQGDYAMMGVAVVLTRAADRVASARLAFLSAGPTPMLAPRAAAALAGAGPDAFADAAETAAQEIDPMGSVQASIPYQRHLARVLARRALALAWGRAA
jgi:carbon-monoxide dehydrogenase medium subunit